MTSEYDEIGENSYFQRSQQFLMIYKDNTNTNRCFISTMANRIFQWWTIVKPLHNKLPQIIPKCSSNIMILIHGQPRNAQHKSLQPMNLSLVSHLHQFSLLCPHNFRHTKSSTKGNEGCPLSKGLVFRRNCIINWLMVFEIRCI